MHYTGITCITSNYTHPTATSRQFVGFICTVYSVLRRVLAAKGGIADPDQPCHSTFGPPPSSRCRQLVGQILRCLELASRVDTTECAGPWIPWAPLWLILQVLMPSKRPPGQLAAYTFCERDVVEYYLLVRDSESPSSSLVRAAIRCPLGKMVFTNFCSIVRKDMLGKCSGLNLMFVSTSSILSPLSYDMSVRTLRSHVHCK